MGLEAATKALLDAGEVAERIQDTHFNYHKSLQVLHMMLLRLLSLGIAMGTRPAAKYVPILPSLRMS